MIWPNVQCMPNCDADSHVKKFFWSAKRFGWRVSYITHLVLCTYTNTLTKTSQKYSTYIPNMITRIWTVRQSDFMSLSFHLQLEARRRENFIYLGVLINFCIYWRLIFEFMGTNFFVISQPFKINVCIFVVKIHLFILKKIKINKQSLLLVKKFKILARIYAKIYIWPLKSWIFLVS